MARLLEGRRLSDIVFADAADPDAMARAEQELRRTEITQPAVLTVDIALSRLLGEYGIAPDLVMGHSLGEYGALVAAGALSFEAALEAVSARGREMASLLVEDPGAMAAVVAPLPEIEEIVAGIDGYVVLANVNSTHQVVLGGATDAVGRAMAALAERGHQAIGLPVSHAFHTEIVASVSGPLRATLRRLGLRGPRLPIVANVDGELYPTGDGVQERMLDLLAAQVASPVQFVKGLRTLYDEGARIFVEVGPKRALQGFASDVLGDDRVLSVATNHPKPGDVASFNTALCGLWAAGLGVGLAPAEPAAVTLRAGATGQARAADRRPAEPVAAATPAPSGTDREEPALLELGRLFAEFLERGRALMGERDGAPASAAAPVVVTGAALGLPGSEHVFDEGNLARLLDGRQGIDVIPARLRREMLDKHVTRLVKGEEGGASFESIDRADDVIKLAGRAGAFDLEREFGVEADRVAALGRTTQLAIAAGIDALRDAGLPLVLRYKTTTTGTQLPDRWSLPDELRDDTGVIFASAFPGLEEMAGEVGRQTVDRMRRERLDALESLRARMLDHDGTDAVVLAEVDRRTHDLRHQLEEEPYAFDRRFIFRILSMGHSQFAELIGARGPNTQVNAACASTTQAVALAEDWIRGGRCRRVVVVAADDATSDTLLSWIGAGFLAAGAAATDDVVEDAALPFDRRRHGMIIGMGAAALVVEGADAARERGLTPICEVLGSASANSAFHGTRLDVGHIGSVMETVVAQAEARGARRAEMAGEMLFVSHETYTPARGGSAAAEIDALRRVFAQDADRIVIANTKGFTGHPMGVGLEDVLAVKALETGVVPPVPNFREVDPDLGALNVSHGGAYPVRYSLRLAAGFGSQIAVLLLRWTPAPDGRRRRTDELGFDYRIADRAVWTAWLKRVAGRDDPRLEVVQHRLRVADSGPAAAAAAVAPEPVAVPLGAPVEDPPEPASEPAGAGGAPAAAPRPAPEPVAPAPAAPAPDARARAGRAGAGAGARGGRRRRGARAGDRRRADRLPTRPPRHRPRPRGRPRDRHRQAGRGLRDDPRGLRHRARRQPQAARLPHHQPRRRLRPRPRPPERPRARRPRARAGRAGAGAGARGGRRRRGARAGDRRRADRLPARPPRHRPRPRGRPRHRHRQAGRGLRRRSARPTASSATTASSCATTPPSTTSSASSTTAPPRAPPRPPPPRPRRPRPRRQPAPAAERRARRLPAPRPRRGAAAAARSVRAHRRAARRGQPRRADARRRWRRRRAGRAPRAPRRRGPRDRGSAHGRRARDADRRLGGRWADRGRLLAARPRRRGARHGARARRPPPGPPRAREAAGGRDARARRARRRARDVPARRHAAGRTPRLRGRRRDVRARRRRHRLHEGARPRAARPARQGRRLRAERRDRRPGRRAHRGDASRPGRRRGRPRRRRALVRRPRRGARRARRRARARRRHGLPRHGRGRQHRVRDHRRPGHGLRRELPPARPRRGPRPRRPRRGAVGRRPRWAHARPRRPPARARRAPDAQARRARARADRARDRGARRDRRDRGRRRQRPLAPGRPDRPRPGGRGGRGRARRERAHRRAGPLRRPGDQPPSARQAPARVRPRLRRQGRRLAEPAARARRGRRRRALGRDRLQLDRRTLRQRRPDRLRGGQRPALQERLAPAPAPGRRRVGSPSTGPRGRRSAWPAAARSRR